MVIALTGKRRMEPRQLAEVKLFLESLRDSVRELTLLVDPRYFYVYESLRLESVDAREAVSPAGASLVVSIGGDGTILKAARWVGSLEIPILGVNSGRLGYLAAVQLSDAESVVSAIVDGALRSSSRRLLRLEVKGLDRLPRELEEWPYALNEIAVLRCETASMITVDALLDSMPLASYQADGLIVSTPTGSTAYNLSVGGPVMAPSTRTWVVAPIAAHQLTLRPLVVGDDSCIELTAHSRSRCYRVSLDGRSVTLPLTARLRITSAPFSVKIAGLPGQDFLTTLRQKLYWGLSARG